MSRLRVVLVQGLVAVLVAGSFYDIVTKAEHWPFSPYQMYAA